MKATKINYSIIDTTADSSLTITPVVSTGIHDDYNMRVDLTLSKGMHFPGFKGKKLVDATYIAQRRFFKEAYSLIIDRFNSSGLDKIMEAYVVFEVQSTTLNVHTHAHLRLKCSSTHLFVQRKLRDVVVGIGFSRMGIFIEYIKNINDSWNYLLKRDTKVPDYVVHYCT